MKVSAITNLFNKWPPRQKNKENSLEKQTNPRFGLVTRVKESRLKIGRSS